MSLPAALLWKWHRLRAMSPAEIAARLRERLLLPDDRNIPRELSGFTLGSPAPLPGFLPDPDAAPDPVRRHTAALAEAIRHGRWTLFESLPLQTTLPPDWHHDPLSGGTAPADTPSRALDHRTCPSGCDPRVLWELSRLLQPVHLAQDLFLNQNTTSADTLLDLLEDWHRNNPLGFGLNWCSALEAGLRLINLTWIDALLDTRLPPAPAGRWHTLRAALIPAHVLFLHRHLSPGSSANNHLLGELAGLSLALARWPALASLGPRPDAVRDRLHRETLRQFAPDGGNREQALHYHLFAWELLWHALRLSPLPEPLHSRLRDAAAFYTALAPDTTPAWDFGDGDDAVVTPLCIHPAPAEWKHWFLRSPKAPGLSYWLGPCPFPLPDLPPTRVNTFPDTGHAALHTPHGLARLDASPLGLPPMYAHGHLDTLHLSLWIHNCPVLIDPGTGAYYADSALRTRLASADSHNGPVPAGPDSLPKRLGPFLWSAPLPPATLHTAPHEIAATCGPLRRAVRYSHPEWIIEDTLPPAPPCRLRFILAPEWAPVPGTHPPQFTHPAGHRLLIRTEAPHATPPSLETLTVSPAFRTLRDTHALTIQATGQVRTILKLTCGTEPS